MDAISDLTGLPLVTAPRSSGKLPGKASKTLAATLDNHWFVSPGTRFCSWITKGRPRIFAMSPPGPEAKPPIPRTRLGLRRPRISLA